MKRIFLVAFTLCFATPVFSADDTATIKSTLKTLIQAIRYNKNDLAAPKVNFQAMSERMMGAEWKQLTPAEQGEMVKGVETLIRKISFQKGFEQFKYLDATLINKVDVQGVTAKAKTVVVIHRDLKKTEIAMDFELKNTQGNWQVVDLVLANESTLDGIREDDVKPLLKEGGTKAVMDALRKRVAEVK